MSNIPEGRLSELLEVLGLPDEPLGLFFTDVEPTDGFSPNPSDLPTREKEDLGEIDWPGVFGNFSCVIRNMRWARLKKKPAYISGERFGCPGAAFWLGFNKPQAETIISYVSTGIPGRMEGERYCDSPDTLREIFSHVDPPAATGKYCVIQPISLFSGDDEPLLVVFFARPESLSGLHQLAFFVTNDPEVVASPWSSGCGSIGAWPLHYLERGQKRAVIGGWDPSARQYYNNDELSFTTPYGLFLDMLERWEESFLTSETWSKVKKKIARSNKVWGAK